MQKHNKNELFYYLISEIQLISYIKKNKIIFLCFWNIGQVLMNNHKLVMIPFD